MYWENVGTLNNNYQAVVVNGRVTDPLKVPGRPRALG